MYYRTRPQRPRGVNRTAGIWQWLQRWMLKTHHNHQFYPRRFHLRGISIGLLIAIPALLWMRASLWSSQDPTQTWSGGACPPQTPIPIQEIIQHPERFQEQPVWVVGRPAIYKKQCFSNVCAGGKKPCCAPCQGRLALQRKAAILPLEGWVPTSSGAPLRLACRGTTCSFSCKPLLPGQTYAFYGRPRMQIKTQGSVRRFQYKFQHFQVLRFCRTNTSRVWRTGRPKLKDPVFRRKQKR
ncbi:MAG: hypothetical protein EP343_28590 [Deltaproteobacteria bacterium]|nr:MAG: hypothetical protein EP343_28590 [Deltaproteobacteria bacterium]